MHSCTHAQVLLQHLPSLRAVFTVYARGKGVDMARRSEAEGLSTDY